MIGDAGVMSGLIATNHSELEQSEAQGRPQLLRVHPAEGRPADPALHRQAAAEEGGREAFPLHPDVSADDRNIEKKDKNLDEPVQFYTGKDPVLFEIVVNNIDKNKVSGYLSTPKNAGGHGAVAHETRVASGDFSWLSSRPIWMQANAERGTLDASPVLLCLGLDYFFFFAVFFAAFLAAFLVAILPILPID